MNWLNSIRLTSMGKTERPETQIGGRVRNATEKILNGVNGLLDEYLGHVELALVLVTAILGHLFVLFEQIALRIVTFDLNRSGRGRFHHTV